MASLNSKFCFIQSRSWIAFLLVLGFVGLTGCSRSLDPKATEKALKDELAKQGVGSLKEVSCPGGMAPGQRFDCTGIFESGIGFRIPVEQKGEGDKLVWEIPSIKGMLNMNQVMKTMRDELKLGDGTIDCGTVSSYRMVTVGSTFECVLPLGSPVVEEKAGVKGDRDAQMAKSADNALDSKLPTPKEPSKTTKDPDKIEISIASSGDVTWQRMVAPLPGKAGSVEPGTKADTKPSTAAPKAGTKESEKPAETKPSSGKPAVGAEETVEYDS